MHRKLKISDYMPLLDKLRAQFTSWTSRAISYTGRLQIIRSVIYGLLNFSFSVFILPKGCLTKIQNLCPCFLWSGDITEHFVPKISWQASCLPKEKGGLGLRNVSIWNHSLCLRLIWTLYYGSNSLWAAWVKENRIQNIILLAIDSSSHTSWNLRAVQSLRHSVSDLLKSKVGNEYIISFRYDS